MVKVLGGIVPRFGPSGFKRLLAAYRDLRINTGDRMTPDSLRRVNDSEKFIVEFSNHKRPHLTTDTHIKNNDKRKVALLLGELISPSCIITSGDTFGRQGLNRPNVLKET